MRLRRILVAPDSFKESLPAGAVANALKRGILASASHVEVTCLPMADGGEGTGDVLLGMGGVRVPSLSHSIYGAAQPGYWVRWHRLGLVESALGSPFVPPGARTGSGEGTTSIGTGALTRAALEDQDVDIVYVSLGGTGSTDGGMGFLAGLGARFWDRDGHELEPFGSNMGRVAAYVPPPPLPKPLLGLYDVGVPLLGERGAVRLFGPQKGIASDRLNAAEADMERFVDAVRGGPGAAHARGAGAAGGIGFGILAAGGELARGAQVIGDWSQLNDHIAACDVVITGEGRIDQQTIEGKVVGHVVEAARRHEKPVIAVVGSRVRDLTALHQAGLTAVMPLVSGPMTLWEALQRTEELLVATGEELGYLIAALTHQGNG